MRIVIESDGTTRMIDSPLVAALQLGVAAKRRASHVLPANHLLRSVFRRLRDRYGETGVVAWFTRRWPCRWIADLSPVSGPSFGPFRHRADAIAAEVDWLDRNWL